MSVFLAAVDLRALKLEELILLGSLGGHCFLQEDVALLVADKMSQGAEVFITVGNQHLNWAIFCQKV